MTATLLGLLARQAGLRAVTETLARADLRWLAGAVLCAGAALVAAAFRWAWCLRAFGLEVPFGMLVRLTLAGHAAGLSGLGAAGMDVTRGGLLTRLRPGSLLPVAGSVAIDHTSALPAALIVTGIGLAAVGLLPSTGALIAGFLIAAVVFVLTGQLIRKVRPAWHARVHAMAADPACRRAFFMACLISVPIMALHCAIFICTARSMGVETSAAGMAGTAAAADAVAALPVSVAGLGVREQAFVVLLGRWFAVPADKALSLSVAGWAALSVWALAGIGCLAAMRGQNKARS